VITVLVIGGILLGVALLLLVAERFLVTWGECTVCINEKKNFKAEGGDTLLTYMNQNRVFIPSACGGKATCGFCKVNVESGGGDILPTEEVYVTAAERAEGVRLACQVKVKRDLNIRVPEFLLTARQFQAKTVHAEMVTHDIRLVRFRIEDGGAVDFRPGQYIQLKIPGTDEYRAYSVASQPSRREELELVIRLVPGGLCSGYVHRALEEGDEVTFTGPFGDFYLQEDSHKDIVAIGGGCGMAPIRSIVYHLAERGMPRRVTFFFGAREKRDLFFTEELRKLEAEFPNFRYVPALSEPRHTDAWDGEAGLITHVAERLVSLEGAKEAYLCGPPPMIDAAMVVLPRRGIRPEDIFFDKF
jgi:Na+-transporting NADH:ubiquinone oxidoreductase subunit F